METWTENHVTVFVHMVLVTEPGSMYARQAFYHLGIPSPQHVTSLSGF